MCHKVTWKKYAITRAEDEDAAQMISYDMDFFLFFFVLLLIVQQQQQTSFMLILPLLFQLTGYFLIFLMAVTPSFLLGYVFFLEFFCFKFVHSAGFMISFEFTRPVRFMTHGQGSGFRCRVSVY